MPTVEEQIKEIQDEMDKTQKNKNTQHHLGKLKAKISRLRDEAEKRRSSGGATGKSYAVRKSGNATIGFVGFPSVGKSTLLTKITEAKSEIAAYEFTTLDVIPGVMTYRGAKIQVLDMPGMVKGAATGRGRGREILSVIRSLDIVVLFLDVYNIHWEVLEKELYASAVRLNGRPPDINLSKKDRGGIEIHPTLELTKIDIELAEDIVREYGFINADVVIREDVTEDQLIDFLSGNRVYIPSLLVLNKIDMVDPYQLAKLKRKLKGWKVIPISADKEIGIAEFKEDIYSMLDFINIFMKPQSKPADMKEPMVVKSDSTVGMICEIIHRDFRRRFRYATVWGNSAKFPGQMVGLEHELADGDILTIVVKRG
ncbi:MAG: GTP-binding protein [Candidatus Thermoplasmatota archaeon]|nr:GTP-binding protein [Euryarchaeota archaeon]MBU4032591.1 GTP-binding protein [Candidatus Thermoplasmatota archaeon]MBU4070652.1 GTP-binding protein [Candidatus Thermoplasmatota archaeon]MBU4145094.1 GTP-binding protein [Candidatus Thermoplasmatota archaeon]MBU4592227.1 GTP-binding protein [Candidatus Thermoplasmatota archaeon]